MPASQAGRRGFESRLPLHKINDLAVTTLPRFVLFYLENPACPPKRPRLSRLQGLANLLGDAPDPISSSRIPGIRDGGDAEKAIAAFAKAGIDDEQPAADLQRDGAESFVKSWKDPLDRIGSRHTALKADG
jgi:hypothetical protein